MVKRKEKECWIPSTFSECQKNLLPPFEPYQQAFPGSFSLSLSLSPTMPTSGFPYSRLMTDWEITGEKENGLLLFWILGFFADQPTAI